MYKNILVPVDGSDTSYLALTEAVALAKEQQAKLRLLHVVDLTPPYMLTGIPFPMTEYEKAIRDAGEKILADSAAKIRDSGVTFDTKCQLNNSLARRISDVISDEAGAWPADLIVIGTHGRRGVDRFRLGSVAEGVVRVATKPVLSIRGS
jgi:nucleotide-binding universal stress UspA family protein